MDGTKYDKDYYEHGVEKRVSGYQDYHWMPTRSYPEAIDIKKCFNHKVGSIIEIGCAKGFLVHALRQLGYDAYGEDISEYAVENAFEPVKPYISLPTKEHADLVICKDILEHVPEDEIDDFLINIKKKCARYLFAVIPLGDNNLFRIREYELDITHVLKKDEDWWINKFREHGFILENFNYSFGKMKRKWVEDFPHGNGFFILSRY